MSDLLGLFKYFCLHPHSIAVDFCCPSWTTNFLNFINIFCHRRVCEFSLTNSSSFSFPSVAVFAACWFPASDSKFYLFAHLLWFCSCPPLRTRYKVILCYGHANLVDGTAGIPTLISTCQRAHHQIIIWMQNTFRYHKFHPAPDFRGRGKGVQGGNVNKFRYFISVADAVIVVVVVAVALATPASFINL